MPNKNPSIDDEPRVFNVCERPGLFNDQPEVQPTATVMESKDLDEHTTGHEAIVNDIESAVFKAFCMTEEMHRSQRNLMDMVTFARDLLLQMKF